VAASAYALDRWFSLGVAVSGWIGLPQFAPAMQKLNTESGRWGLAALALQCVAILMILPRKPKKSAPAFSTGWPPSEPLDAHAWIEHLGHRVLRTALVLFHHDSSCSRLRVLILGNPPACSLIVIRSHS